MAGHEEQGLLFVPGLYWSARHATHVVPLRPNPGLHTVNDKQILFQVFLIIKINLCLLDTNVNSQQSFTEPPLVAEVVTELVGH